MSTETKVVQLKFDNKQFEEGCRESMATLDKLDEKIKGTQSGSALSELGRKIDKVDFSNLNNSIDAVQKRFSVLGIAGMTAISEITKSAMHLGKTILTAIPNQIKNGGWNRAMNIEKAKFQLEGLGIAWDKVGNQISNAVSGTAYGMDQAARAASQLAASGVSIGRVYKDNIDEMEMTLKAISGVAAQTNSDYDSISRIFTQVAGQGRLMGDQLLQLSQRGMNAAATLGKALGKSEAEIRDMVRKGEIGFKQFSEAMYDAFAENAFKANNTFEGALSNMKAALSRTGEYFSGPIIRQMIPVWNSLRKAINRVNEEVQLFSSNKVGDRSTAEVNFKRIHKEVENLNAAYKEGKISVDEYNKKHRELQMSLDSAQKELLDTYGPFERFLITIRKSFTGWVDSLDFSWVEAFGNGIVNLGKMVINPITAIGKAFNATFGKDSQSVLQGFANGFETLTSKLVLSKKEMAYLKITFQGVFDVLEAVLGIFGDLLGAIIGIDTSNFKLREHLLLITAVLGRLLTHLANLIKSLELAGKIINGFKMGIGLAAGGIGILVEKIKIGANTFSKFTDGMSVFEKLQFLVNLVTNGVSELASKVKELVNEASPDLFKNISKRLEGIKDVAVNLFKSIDTAKAKPIFDFVVKRLENIKNAFVRFKDFVISGIKTMKSAINDLLGKKEADNITKTITIVDDQVALAGPHIEKTGKQVKSFTDILKLGLQEIGNRLQNADWVKVVVSWSESIRKAGNNFIQFVKDIGISGWTAIAFITSMIVVFYKLSKAFQNLTLTVKSTARSISGVLNLIGSQGIMGLIFGPKVQPKPNKLIQLAEAVVLLATAFGALALIPRDKLIQGGIALASMAGGIIVMMTAITVCEKILGKGAEIKIASSVLAIAGSMALMAGAIALLGSLTFEAGALATVIEVLAGMTLGLAALSAILAKAAPALSANALSLLAMAGSMLIMVKALDALNKLELTVWDENKGLNKNLVAKIAALGALMLVLVTASGIAAKLGTNSLLGIVVALVALKAIVPLADSVADAIKDSIFAEWWTKLIDFFSRFPDWLKEIGPYATAAISIAAVIVGIVIAFKAIKKALSSLGKIFSGTQKEVQKFSGLQTALSRLSLVPVIIALTGMMIAIGALALVVGNIKVQYLKQMGIIMGVIVAMFVSVGIVAKLSKGANTGALLTAIGGLTVIFSEFIVLSLLMEQHYMGMLGAVLSMIMIMHHLADLLDTAMEAGQKGTKGLVALGIAAGILGELGIALYAISKNKNTWQQVASIAAAGGAMWLAIKGFASLMETIGQTGLHFHKEKLIALAEMAAMVGILGASLYAISKNDWKSIAASGVAMLLSMATFGNLLETFGKMQNIKATDVLGLVGVAFAVVELGGALYLVSKNDWSSIAAAMVAVNVTMFLFSTLCNTLSNIQLKGEAILNMAAIAGECVAIGYALSLVAKYEWPDIYAAAIAMNATMIVMAAIMALLGGGGEASMIGAAVLLAVAAASWVLAKAFEAVTPLVTQMTDALLRFTTEALNILFEHLAQIDELAVGLISLAGALTVMSFAGMTLLLGGPGLVMGATAVDHMASALVTLSGVNINEIATGLSNLAVPLIKLALVGAVYELLGNGIEVMARAFVMFGNAMLIVANALNTGVVDKIDDLPEKMVSIGKQIPISLATGMKNTSAIATAVAAAKNIATKIENAIRNGLQVHSPSPMFMMIGLQVCKSLALGIGNANGVNSVKNQTKKVTNGIVTIADEAAPKAGKAGEGIIERLANGFINSGAGQKILGYAQGLADTILKEWSTLSGLGSGENGGLPDWAQDVLDSTQDMDDIIGDATASLGDFSGASDKAGKSAKDASEDIKDLSEAFKAVSKGEKYSLQEMTTNLRANLKEHAKWAFDIRQMVAKGYDQTIVEQAQKMGVAGHNMVKAYLSATEEEVAELNTNAQKWFNVDEETKKIIAGDYGEFGSDTATAYLGGFADTIDTEFRDTLKSQLDPFAEFNSKVELSSADLLKNMQSQLDGYRKWGGMLNDLMARGVEEGIIDHFKQAGISSYEELSAMVNMTDEQLAQAREIWKQQEMLPDEIAGGVNHQANLLGLNLDQGLIDGIASKAGEVTEASRALAQDVLDTYAETSGIHSPSEITYQDGVFLLLGLKNGLGDQSTRKALNQVVLKLAENTFDLIEASIGFKPGKYLGTTMCDGLIAGLRTGSNAVTAMARQVAIDAYNAARVALDAHSPSKKFEQLGQWLDEGFAIGIDRNSNSVVSSTEAMADSAIQIMSGVVTDLLDSFNGSPEFSPVITPELDLTKIQNEKYKLNSMFRNPAYEMATDVSISRDTARLNEINATTETPVGNTSNQTVIFNQTNNSPKSIDPYESYRLSRLAMEQMRGAFT